LNNFGRTGNATVAQTIRKWPGENTTNSMAITTAGQLEETLLLGKGLPVRNALHLRGTVPKALKTIQTGKRFTWIKLHGKQELSKNSAKSTFGCRKWA